MNLPVDHPSTPAEHKRTEARELEQAAANAHREAERIEDDAVRPTLFGRQMESGGRRRSDLLEFWLDGVQIFEWDRPGAWNASVHKSHMFAGGALATIEVKSNSARLDSAQKAADCIREGLLLLRSKIDEMLSMETA